MDIIEEKGCEDGTEKKEGQGIWGLQIHPEIDVETGKKLLKDLLRLHPVQKSLFEKALESRPRDSRLTRRIVKAFSRLERGCS